MLGWKPSHTRIKKSQISLIRTFVPLEAHIKEHPAWFKRFEAVWTPTILVMDSDGVERYRIEGYLPKDWFRARLKMGLARVAFMQRNSLTRRRFMTEVIEKFVGDRRWQQKRFIGVRLSVQSDQRSHGAGTGGGGTKPKISGDEWTLKSGPWAH